MKRILFVIESLHCGGAEKSLVTLLNSLDLSSYSIDLQLFKKNGEFEKLLPAGVNLLYTPIAATGLRTGLARLRYFALRRWPIGKRCHPAQAYWRSFGHLIEGNQKNYDVVIAYNQGFATYYAARKTAAKTKYAWLNTDYEKAGYCISLDYPFYTHFDAVVCVSKQNEEGFQKVLRESGLDLKTLVIPDIVNAGTIRAMSRMGEGLPATPGQTTILTIGRLASAKGYELAIEACALLIGWGYPISWFVIGEGPERDFLEELIQKKGMEEHFILLGYRENPYPLLKSADLYVQTSRFEGLGLSVIEATLLHKPIASTNFETAHALLRHEETGLICEMDPEAIAEAVRRYIDESHLREKVIANLEGESKYNSKNSLRKVYELLLS